MSDLLGVLTAFGVMFGGERLVTGPILCDKEITATVEEMVLQDEGGKLGENIQVERHEAGPQSYDIQYRIRETDGVEKRHAYHVDADKECKDIKAKRI